MTAPDKPDWEAVAEALEFYDQEVDVGFIGQLKGATRWALQHGPAIDNAETVWWCERYERWCQSWFEARRDGGLPQLPAHSGCGWMRLLPLGITPIPDLTDAESEAFWEAINE